jgi:hypothetical protein
MTTKTTATTRMQSFRKILEAKQRERGFISATSSKSEFLNRLRDKPFWIWNEDLHRQEY